MKSIGVVFQEHSIQGSLFHIPEKYTDLKTLGIGAQGHVCSAIDTTTQTQVAIKKILSPFQDAHNAKRVYREIKLLKHVRHETIVAAIDMFVSPTDDVYLVFEKAEWNLKQMIEMRLDERHYKHLFYQILYGLKYLHLCNIAHRDLKPNNILVKKSGHVKICDFGLARIIDEKERNLMVPVTGYVVTRYYRAPEIVLHWQSYQKSIDMWSAGCILAEMLTSQLLFAGHSPIDQFNKITEICGKPDDIIINTINDPTTAQYVRNLPNRPRIPMNQVFPNLNPDACDLLDQIFVYDPEKRISASDALRHSYFKDLPYPRDDGSPPKEFDWSFKLQELSLPEWREYIIQEIESFGAS